MSRHLNGWGERHQRLITYLIWYQGNQWGDKRGPTTAEIQSATRDMSPGTTISEVRALIKGTGRKLVKTFGGTVNGRKRYHYRYEMEG